MNIRPLVHVDHLFSPDSVLFPLDPVTLSDWLIEEGHPDGVVGHSCHDADCPLSRFLSFLYGGSWLVHYEQYERLGNDLLYDIDACFDLPAWAIRFVWLIDWSAACLTVPVLAPEALPLLRQACGESGVSLEVQA